ncbi:hypothetical protein BC833DRAFT_571873 [Globomyces pollinis-pini]|nr:hypothetical protein BC833DRAFT_571873 [Globomyces pollinis-pini]
MDYEYEIEEGEDLLLTLQFTIPPNLNQNSNQRSLRPLPHRQDGHARAFLELIQQNASQLATIAIQSWIDLNNDQASDTPKKASDLAFKSLQRIHVLSEKRRLKHVLCAICQDEFPNKTCFENAKTVESSVDSSVNTEQIIRMPCHHLYHESCLAGWLNNNSTCPTCRYEVSTMFINFF